MSTHDNVRFTNRNSNKGKDSLKSAEPEPEYNIDDLVTVSVNYDDDDSDPELLMLSPSLCPKSLLRHERWLKRKLRPPPKS